MQRASDGKARALGPGTPERANYRRRHLKKIGWRGAACPRRKRQRRSGLLTLANTGFEIKPCDKRKLPEYQNFAAQLFGRQCYLTVDAKMRHTEEPHFVDAQTEQHIACDLRMSLAQSSVSASASMPPR